MQAGKQLDALIAEKVMGWADIEWVELKHASSREPKGLEPGKKSKWNIPHYSTDIAAAWLVVEKLDLLNGRSLSYFPGAGWQVWHSLEVKDKNGFIPVDCVCDTPAHAICLAALKVVEE